MGPFLLFAFTNRGFDVVSIFAYDGIEGNGSPSERKHEGGSGSPPFFMQPYYKTLLDKRDVPFVLDADEQLFQASP